jgi:archaetidylinositol phosphate synthase
MSDTTFNEAARMLSSVLAPAERRLLVWLADRLPARINADHLTGLGLVAMLMVGLSYGLARWTPAGLALATFWLGVNWFGDSLDGTVARVRSQQRPRYGFYVDHVVDLFGTLCLVAGMGWSSYMSPMVALALLVGYTMLAAEAYLSTYARRTFQLSFWMFGPTELRVVIAVGNIALLVRHSPLVLGGRFLLFDVGGIVALVCMALVLVLRVACNLHALYREEPLPRPGR